MARETLCRSVMGRITEPTVMQLKPSSTKISTPSSTVASCAPTRLLICLDAQRPNAAEPPDLFISATIAPISSWAAAVTYSVPPDSGINGFSMFLRTIPYNFYALGTVLMMVLIVTLKLDYGPMKLHERNALAGDLFTTPDRPYADADSEEPSASGSVADLVLPVAVLIAACIIGIVYTGGFFDGVGFIDAFADSNSAMGPPVK